MPNQGDRSHWPTLRATCAGIFRTRTRDGWTELLEGIDSCVTPALSMREAPTHRHSAARKSFIAVDDIIQPAPAPRFSRTPAGVSSKAAVPGQHPVEVLREAAFD
ncbi:CoA transferase [Rhodococcus sp. NPDC057529]|uniref:CoA transferase n=1 Tax=Rhodococcus sp. NPDC057529 TaxID=3346158 RepID=UPI00366E59AB